MSDDEDYLSDKFLLEATVPPALSKTYSALRKDAHRRSSMLQVQNKVKGVRQREQEAREKGLSKSLFETAKEEEAAGLATNKALSIMMKMGFKPGQSLGSLDKKQDENEISPNAGTTVGDEATTLATIDSSLGSGVGADITESFRDPHKLEPLPLNEWQGRKGIGTGKRTRSPSAAERMAKMIKMAEESEKASQSDFRERSKIEYEARRAEGKLGPAQRTCLTLDEESGVSYNVLWLNPSNPETFPLGLLDALELQQPLPILDTEPRRIRDQMQKDALQPLGGIDEEPGESIGNYTSNTPISAADQFTQETLEEAYQFLRLQAQDRLHLVLAYLRRQYSYCFWCGVRYESQNEMKDQCPGVDEDDHD